MFQKFSSFEIIDSFIEGKSSPTRRIAHRASFDDVPRRDGFLYVRSRAISSRINDNYDEFPAEEIKKAYKTFIGKPVFVNHHNSNHKRARGVIVAAALHEDVTPEGLPDTWVEVLMEIDAVKFPKLADAVMKGKVNRTSMGTDVEFSICSACGNKAESPLQYCAHIPSQKGMKLRRKGANGEQEDVLIYESCYGLSFFENSLLVEEPADPTAFILGEPELVMAKAASKSSIRAIADVHTQLDEWFTATYTPASGFLVKTTLECKEHGALIEPDATHDPGSARNLVNMTAAAHNDGFHRTAGRRVSFGETRAPGRIDTMTDESCPICGSDFDGERCQVCQYVKPPDPFLDPDLERAQEFDKRQEEGGSLADEVGFGDLAEEIASTEEFDDPEAIIDTDPVTEQRDGVDLDELEKVRVDDAKQVVQDAEQLSTIEEDIAQSFEEDEGDQPDGDIEIGDPFGEDEILGEDAPVGQDAEPANAPSEDENKDSSEKDRPASEGDKSAGEGGEEAGQDSGEENPFNEPEVSDTEDNADGSDDGAESAPTGAEDSDGSDGEAPEIGDSEDATDEGEKSPEDDSSDTDTVEPAQTDTESVDLTLDESERAEVEEEFESLISEGRTARPTNTGDNKMAKAASRQAPRPAGAHARKQAATNWYDEGYERGQMLAREGITTDEAPAPLSGEWAGESIPEIFGSWDAATDEAMEDYEEGYYDGIAGERRRASRKNAGFGSNTGRRKTATTPWSDIYSAIAGWNRISEDLDHELWDLGDALQEVNSKGEFLVESDHPNFQSRIPELVRLVENLGYAVENQIDSFVIKEGHMAYKTSRARSREAGDNRQSKAAKPRVLNMNDRLAAQARRISDLERALTLIAKAAGLSKHPAFLAVLKRAEIAEENPAQPFGFANPAPEGEEAPEATSEEALGFDNESPVTELDDLEQIGETSEADVEPDAQTSLTEARRAAAARRVRARQIRRKAETVLDEPLDLNEEDVTAPVAGTDDLGEGPAGEAGSGRTEIDPVVGDNIDNPEVAFDLADGGWQEDTEQAVAAKRGEARTYAALRLARLRIQAGIAQGDDLSLANRIVQSKATTKEINAEADVLAQVVSPKAKRQVSRSSAPRLSARRSSPAFAAPSALHTAVTSVSEDEFLFE